MSNIKILNITSDLTGGAGISAKRFHEALLSEKFLSDTVTYNQCLEKSFSYKFNVKIKVLNRVFKLIRNILNLSVLSKQRENEIFTQQYFNNIALNKIIFDLSTDYDIIIFHWVFNFINFSTIKQLSKKKRVFFYLHDSKVNHGIIHYSIEKENLNFKARILESLFSKFMKIDNWDQDVHFLSPSNWLITESLKFKSIRKISYLPYSLNSGTFENKNKVSGDDFRIIFISQKVDNTRKGFRYLIEALKMFDCKIVVDIIGENKFGENIFLKCVESEINFLGRLSDIDIFRKLDNANVFILPSIQDNLPNTMLESLIVGCPVICFNNSGMAETIIHGFNGLITDNQSGFGLYTEIMKVKNNEVKFNRELVRIFSRFEYSTERQIGLFKNIIQ